MKPNTETKTGIAVVVIKAPPEFRERRKEVAVRITSQRVYASGRVFTLHGKPMKQPGGTHAAIVELIAYRSTDGTKVWPKP